MASTRTRQLAVLEHDLSLATKRYEQLERQFAMGLVPETQLLQGRLDMLTVQQDVTVLRTRIQTLQGGGR